MKYNIVVSMIKLGVFTLYLYYGQFTVFKVGKQGILDCQFQAVADTFIGANRCVLNSFNHVNQY